MNKEAIEQLIYLTKNEVFQLSPVIRIRKEHFDNRKTAFTYIFDRQNGWERFEPVTMNNTGHLILELISRKLCLNEIAAECCRFVNQEYTFGEAYIGVLDFIRKMQSVGIVK